MAIQNQVLPANLATGTGTSGTITKWTGTTALGNSILTEVTSTITLTGGVTVLNTGFYTLSSINDFLQYDIKNTSTGTSAQTTYSLTADNGTPTSGFMSININNSTFTAVNNYSIGVANDCSVLSSGQDLYVANASTTKDIIFSLGKVASPFFDEFMRISRSLLQVVFTGTNGAKFLTAATQDAMVIKGRAGGTGSFTGTLIPTTLSASRIYTFPNSTGTVALAATTLAGYGITDAQPLDADLTAIAVLSGNGIPAQTAAGTWALRTIASTSTSLVVTNGNGVAGSPSLAVAAPLQTLGQLANAAGVLTNNGSGTLSWAAAGGALFTGTADATASGTTTELTLVPTGVGTVTLPAGYLTAGKTIRVKIGGMCGLTGTPNLQIFAYLGGGANICATGIRAVSFPSNRGFNIFLEITCRTTGVSGTVVANGMFIANSEQMPLYNSSTSVVDTTGTLAINVTGQWNNANVLNFLTAQVFTVEALN